MVSLDPNIASGGDIHEESPDLWRHYHTSCLYTQFHFGCKIRGFRERLLHSCAYAADVVVAIWLLSK